MYKRLRSGWAKHLDFVLWDMLCAEIAYLLAHIMRAGDTMLDSPLYRYTAILILVSEVLVSVFTASFRDILKRGYLKELGAVIYHVIKVWVIIFFLMFLLKLDSSDMFSRLIFVFSCLLHMGFAYGVRIWWKGVVINHLQKSKSRALLIVVNSKIAELVVNTIKQNNLYSLDIVGVIVWDEDSEGETIAGEKVVANCYNAVDFICHNRVDEVFINLEGEMAPTQFVHSCIQMGLAVHRPIIKETYTQRFIQKFAGYTVVTSAIHVTGSAQQFLKRILDIIGASIGCIFTLILLPFVAFAIKRKSPGPVFFKQERVGENGRIFKMYKFRSMLPDAENIKESLTQQNEMGDDLTFKMEDDPRIIPGIGTFLRKHSLDEFPQFFNVMKGDMSLVGTRPPTIDEWKKYLPNHRVRLAVRPGITGMWQVSGRNEITDFEEIVRLDEQYINEWSFGLDAKILLKTIGSIFKGTGK